MIDAILTFTSAADARTDPILRAHRRTLTEWVGSYVLPDLKVWRASQDIETTAPEGEPVVIHNYLAGWSVLISLPRVVPALRDHPNLRVMIDRDKANARTAGAIIARNVTLAVLNDIRFEPVFAGADYPFGNWQ